MSDLTAVIAELERLAMDHENTAKELAKQLQFHESETKRFRAAIATLIGPTVRTTRVSSTRGRKKSPTGTMTVARKVLSEQEVAKSPGEIVSLMLEAGWETDSENPSNTLRTALRRMADRGEVIQYDDGTYFLPSS